uniref:DNA repair helicase n=1 Tax=uncultured marine thaumarchaeote KM3_95_H05 TaxID=1456348 RepID=A0A075HZC1_9ARCH|nr:DNA repair helicase [uncultured marine thaumarchaeote KM3_95_H05]
MTLRDLSLKQEYRSDRDDVISEFFIPCLTNSIQYDRTIEFISVKSLSTLTFGLENIEHNNAKIRLVSGHRFTTSDLDAIIKLFDQHNPGRLNGRLYLDKKISSLIQDSKIRQLKKIIEDFKLEVKVAIPNSEYVDGAFEERMGIFRDTNDDVVAFSGTSNITFDAENRNFESVDVFTSWDDKARVETKIKNFENLWDDKTNYVQIYDLVYAEKKNLLKYTTEWAVST